MSALGKQKRLERLEENAKHTLEPNAIVAFLYFIGAARDGENERAEYWAERLLEADERESDRLPGGTDWPEMVKAWREGGWEGLLNMNDGAPEANQGG